MCVQQPRSEEKKLLRFMLDFNWIYLKLLLLLACFCRWKNGGRWWWHSRSETFSEKRSRQGSSKVLSPSSPSSSRVPLCYATDMAERMWRENLLRGDQAPITLLKTETATCEHSARSAERCNKCQNAARKKESTRREQWRRGRKGKKPENLQCCCQLICSAR